MENEIKSLRKEVGGVFQVQEKKYDGAQAEAGHGKGGRRS